jgi:hypothetical protein
MIEVENSESGGAQPLYLGLEAITDKSKGSNSFCSIEFDWVNLNKFNNKNKVNQAE